MKTQSALEQLNNGDLGDWAHKLTRMRGEPRGGVERISMTGVFNYLKVPGRVRGLGPMKEAMDGPEVWLPPVPWPRAEVAISQLATMEENLRELHRINDRLWEQLGAGMSDKVLLERLQADARDYTAQIRRLSTKVTEQANEIGRLNKLVDELRAKCKGLAEREGKFAHKEMELRDKEIDRLCLILRAIGKSVQKSVQESKAWTRDLPGDEKASQMSKPVADVGWRVRTQNCLRNEGIVTFGDLVKRTEGQLLRVPNFGMKALKEIKDTLAAMGLHLGMEDVEGT